MADPKIDIRPGTARRLIAFFNRETAGARFRIVSTSLAAGLSRGVLLATVNGAAAAGMSGRADIGLVAAFLAALLIHLSTNFDSGRQSVRVIKRMVQRMRLRLCAQIVAAPLRFVELQGPGRVYARLGYDVDQVANGGLTFLESFRSAVILAFALIYLGWLSIPGFVAGLAVISFSTAAYVWQNRQASKMVKQARAKDDIFYDAMYDLLHGFKELKLSGAQQADLAAHLESVSGEARDLGVRAADMYLKGALTSDTFTFGLIATLVFVLPPLFPSSSVSVFQFLATVLFALGPAEQLITSIPVFTRATISYAKIEQLEDGLCASLDDVEEDRLAAPMSFETIAFKDVHYRFEGASPEETFDLGPIDLVLHKGETLFICGGNGAGKTTLLKLLTGLYQPASGTILIDGKEIGPREHQRYRELFGAVFSDFYLFRKLYGLQAPDPLIVDELLTMLQLGTKTRLNNGAFTTIHLSSGQRKRLAYAVSRLRDRQIYIFDEFAADQDPGFRHYFYSELLPELKRQGKTVVAVTHDERWFEAGDRLVKLDYGTIAAAGTVASGKPGTA